MPELLQSQSVTQTIVAPLSGGGYAYGGRATRMFTGTPPALGSAHPTLSGVVATSITQIPYVVSGTDWAPRYEVEYTSLAGLEKAADAYTATIVTKVPFGTEVSYSGSLGTVSFEAKPGSWRSNDPSVAAVGSQVNSPMPQSSEIDGRIVSGYASGTIEKSKLVVGDSGMEAFVNTFKAVGGKINSTAFLGFPIGCVLLSSFDAKKIKENGVTKYHVSAIYSWRLVNGDTPSSWNCIYTQNGWRRVGAQSSESANCTAEPYQYANIDII